jgi:hypothetical protein
MSEIAAESTVTESTPTSTAEVASNVIDSYEQPESAAAPEQAEISAAAPDEPAPELSPAAKFLLAQGHQSKKVDGRPVWLPYQTVEKMLDRYAGESSKSWETRLTEAEKKAQEAAAFKDRAAAADAYLAAIQGDETQFIRSIAEHDPRYKRFLEQQAAPTQAPVPADDPMPQPDVLLPDGSRTYSLEGLEKRDEWRDRQTMKRLEGTLEERLKPWQEHQEQLKAEKAQAQLRERTATQLETARTWENWTEYEPDILKAMQEDSAKAKAEGRVPTGTLREFYLEVKAAKLAEKATNARTSVLEELKSAPKSTSVPRTAEVTPKPVGPRSTQDIAARTLDRLERGA